MKARISPQSVPIFAMKLPDNSNDDRNQPILPVKADCSSKLPQELDNENLYKKKKSKKIVNHCLYHYGTIAKTRWYMPHLKHKGHCDYSHKEIIFSNSFEYVEFIRLPGIEFIENLQFAHWKFNHLAKNHNPSIIPKQPTRCPVVETEMLLKQR